MGDPSKGQVSSFAAVALFSPGPTDPATFTIGSIDFTLVGSGIANITAGFFNAGFDGAFDNDVPGNPIQPIFNGASITAVPEPSAGLLVLFVGLIAAAGTVCRQRLQGWFGS